MEYILNKKYIFEGKNEQVQNLICSTLNVRA